MKIIIQKIGIKNFKKVDDIIIDVDCKNIDIRGQNGTCKSSIADAVHWLFTGKNSDLSANFNIMPLDINGNRIDHVNAEVWANVKIDDKLVELKKKYRQVWSKKRGSVVKEFSRNTTDHYIDGVPVSQTEYNSYLDNIIDDTLFRMLSDVKFFCGHTKPEFRRQILIDLCGEPLPSDIIAANSELSGLTEIMKSNDMMSHAKIIKSRRKKIEAEIGNNTHDGRLPILIKEKQDEIKNIPEHNENDLRDKLDEITSEINSKVIAIGELSSGIEFHNLKYELISKNAELAKLEADTRKSNTDKLSDKLKKRSELEDTLSKLKTEMDDLIRKINFIEQDIISNAAKRADLKKQWLDEDRRRIDLIDVCYACGQSLPDDQIFKQQDRFNAEKAKMLSKINEAGTQLFAEYKVLKDDLSKMIPILDEKKRNIEKFEPHIDAIDQEIHKINNDSGVEYGKKHNALIADIAKINAKIETYNQEVAPRKSALKSAIEALEDEKDVINSKLLEIKQSEKTKERIEDLKTEYKELIAEYQKIEHEIWMIEEFGRKRAEYIEENVSKHFSIVKWKLFEAQQNGGIKDICEALIDGVPYSSDASTGERIICGLDCIHTFSKYHGIDVTVFIDDNESLTIDFSAIAPKHYITLTAVKGLEELQII